MSESPQTLTPRDSRNTRRYIQLSLLWAVVYIGCTYLLEREYVNPQALRWVVAFIPTLFAAFAARAYWRYVRETDELLREIELKALALAVAAGYILWPAMELLENSLLLETPFPVTFIVMTVVYSIALMKGRMAYL